ncbi:MAG: flavodoxin-dependent (E)-4-hydroxy-3-methylbut-2-enyl-diphosphate synthase [Candidatus Omnitrophica bacterium]|nr:flavodoxin-dependent (E)-4-hydroxy-3-methylbut-2-enyl-diphosphate synthase [Candidatus Omnitrophota bacterium]
MPIERRKTRQIHVGPVAIGGGSPISIQSMTKTHTHDVEGTVRQIRELEKAGCDIVRVAVPDKPSAEAIKKIKVAIKIPLIADIHYDHRLALVALEGGANGIRLNPGNLKEEDRIRQIIDAAKAHKVAIRIGVNAGSVDAVYPKEGPLRHEAREAFIQKMIHRGVEYLRFFERHHFTELKISMKLSNVQDTIESYRRMAKVSDYPFHLGVTEAGLPRDGAIKSALGIGALLLEGIGDTLRVSLTGDPVEEVEVGKRILQFLELRDFGPELIACPSCGRADIDLIQLVEAAEKRLRELGKSQADLVGVKIALMGCEVNGPGEAKDADIGIAAGKGQGMIFKKGQMIRRVKESEMVEALVQEMLNIERTS